MKKALCLIISIVMILSGFAVSTFASSENELTNNVYLISNAPTEQGGRFGSAEDSVIDLEFEVIYLIDGNYQIFIEYIPVTPYNIRLPSTGDSVDAYHIQGSLSYEAVIGINSYNDLEYPLAQRQSNASCKYNCHSYAWYSQDISTHDSWIDNPEQFYADHRYCTVSTPRVGDIICYFDDMGTTSNQADDVNRHSGIITGIETDGTIIVTSKWGTAGVYTHEWDYCSYFHSGDGGADYVVYYREPGRIVYGSSDSLYSHSKLCMECNISINEPHYWVAFGTKYRCSLCRMIAITIPDIQSTDPEELTR